MSTVLNRNKNLFLNKSRFDFIYLFILFILLVSVYLPSLFFPPLSDAWETFYFFHHLKELPGSIKWLHILNHDPVEHMRYQPLSRSFYYVFHLLFGSNFILFNIFNFLFYFFSAFLLYKFALYFSEDRILIAMFIGFFTFLFSHFDIVLWSYHIYIIAGFCMFLGAFMSYIKFLKTAKQGYLIWTALLFLVGMWCYEPFFFWPFAIIILAYISRFKIKEILTQDKINKSNALVLSTVFIVYFLFYLFTRSLNTYERAIREIPAFLQLTKFTSAIFLVLFNVLYNNILLNIYPLLAFPLRVTENIYLEGTLINSIKAQHGIIFIGSTLTGMALLIFLIYLYKRKYREEVKIMGFFLFLSLSLMYITFFCRLVTNELEYGFTEFRYQYVPHAIMILSIIFIVSRFMKLFLRRKIIIFTALTLLLALNIYSIRKVINVYNFHFMNLKKLIINIRTGIHEGAIGKLNKLYVADDLPDYLPNLCWNIELGTRFMKGTYQWMFSEKEIEYFTDNLADAAWEIDKGSFVIVRKGSRNVLKDAKRINSVKDKDYIDIAKDTKYIELGWFFTQQKDYEKARRMFRRAIELNPANNEAYVALEEISHIKIN